MDPLGWINTHDDWTLRQKQTHFYILFSTRQLSVYSLKSRQTSRSWNAFSKPKKNGNNHSLHKVIVNRWPAQRADNPEYLRPTGIIGTNCQWKVALITKAPKLWYLNRRRRVCFARSTPTTLVENRTYVWHVKSFFVRNMKFHPRHVWRV